MALAFYDADQIAFGSDPLRSFHDGNLGGEHEQKIYVRNSDALKYYTSVTLKYNGTVATSNGWSVKFTKGERQPTEAEWDLVASGATISLDDIGAPGAAASLGQRIHQPPQRVQRLASATAWIGEGWVAAGCGDVSSEGSESAESSAAASSAARAWHTRRSAALLLGAALLERRRGGSWLLGAAAAMK